MNGTARIVPSLTGRYTTWLTAVHTKLNETFENRTVTIARMRVAPAGGTGSDCDGKHSGFLILIALQCALKQWLSGETGHLSRRTDSQQDGEDEERGPNSEADNPEVARGLLRPLFQGVHEGMLCLRSPPAPPALWRLTAVSAATAGRRLHAKVGQAGLSTHFTGTALLATMTAAPAELRTNSMNLATVGDGVAFVTRNESRVSM